MIMIMKLQIKLLPNLVGQPEYDPNLELWGSDDEPRFCEMAWGHEIWDGIHVWEQSMDFD